VRGVITYIDPNWGLMFVQDYTGAAFVGIAGLNLRLKAGDLVDVSGVTNPGDYAPSIGDPAVSFVGRGSFPQPLTIDPVQSNLAIADSRWSTCRGVVHSVQIVDGHTDLKLGAGDAALNVQLPTLIDGERFRDKEISVTGALGILFNERRQAIGHQIFVPAPEFLSVVNTGGNPNPESTIATLRRYSPEFDERHSVGFRGQVVLKSASNTVFVQDETAGIQVRATSDLNLNLGDRVSVRGFLRQGEYSPAVEDAVIAREGPGALPQAERVSPVGLDLGRHDSEYVTMVGVLTSIRPARESTTLVLNENGTYFDVVAPSSERMGSLRPGSVVEVRGIFNVTLDRSHVPYTVSGFEVQIDSPKSVTVLKSGPWWDAGRVRWTLLLFGLFASAAVLWATMLRRKVQDKTQALQTSLAAQQRAQQFDRARNEILESIARNAPLPESMERLALAVEEQIPNIVCAVLLPSDGKSFLNGKPTPMFIAPGLPEDSQRNHSFAAALSGGVIADSTHIAAVESDFVPKLVEALRGSGMRFVAAHSSAVFSAAGTVVGMLVLFCKTELRGLSDPVPQNVLQSASRLISLARDHWQMHERLLHEARHDALTGLPNRAVAEDRLEQALARAERRKKSFAVFCIDLDGFKAVNDELGHDAGDELLRAVAVTLRGRIRHSDTLARMGGDEFLAIIDECASDAAARAVADSLIASLRAPIVVEGHSLTLSASIGMAMYPADGQNAAQLKRNADQAMYRAKNNGGGQGCFWSREPEKSSQATRKASRP
jgi:diguanylate cyclase (GGDEF)-like protein